MAQKLICSEWSIDFEQQSKTEQQDMIDVDVILRIEGRIPSEAIQEVYLLLEDLKGYLQERVDHG
jgi:hypothetical protein